MGQAAQFVVGQRVRIMDCALAPSWCVNKLGKVVYVDEEDRECVVQLKDMRVTVNVSWDALSLK